LPDLSNVGVSFSATTTATWHVLFIGPADNLDQDLLRQLRSDRGEPTSQRYARCPASDFFLSK
jgi:hypothetical protein